VPSVNQLAWSLFAIAAALIFYVYIGYPSLLALISGFVKRKEAPLGYTPSVSVLIAAYNEEANIQKKLEQTLELDYPADKLEILVLSDCSTDRTDSIVNAFNHPRVRLVRPSQRRGKTHLQNIGASLANGEVLVFSDATAIYHPQALRYLACNYEDSRVGAVSGRYQYFDATGESPTGLGSIAFWNYENWIKAMQSRIKTISGCCGCIYSVRRSAYTELPDDVISDLVQPLHVIKQGMRVVFESRAQAFEETTESTSKEFTMRVRIVTRAIRGVLTVKELLDPLRSGYVAFQLWSHKALRWLVPVFMLMLLVSTAVLAHSSAFARVLLLAQLLFYGFALLTALVPLHSSWKPLGLPLYFCLMNAAALCGFVEIARGKRYVVWETVRAQQ
jgi:cellulose synthase/poly-beta-1,6-N-acetylglucosamine synthase-like glycosyltransferase